MIVYKVHFGPTFSFGQTLCLQGDISKLDCGTKLVDDNGNETAITSFALSSGKTRRDTVAVICKTASPLNTKFLFIK